MTRRKSKAPSPAPAAEVQSGPLAVAGDPSVTVVFVRAHRHAGVDYLARDKITVTPDVAELLRRYGAIGGE